MSDLDDIKASIADIQRKEAARRGEREIQAAANRERLRTWSPEFYGLIEGLKAAGMFGRLCSFTTTTELT